MVQFGTNSGITGHRDQKNSSETTVQRFKKSTTKLNLIQRILDSLPKSTGSRLTKEEVTKARYEVDKQYGFKVSVGKIRLEIKFTKCSGKKDSVF